jgi:type IV/VI secretion system ImpK/VasF family protein
MHEDIARFVHPVLERGLELRRRLEAGEALWSKAPDPIVPEEARSRGASAGGDPLPVSLVLQELTDSNAFIPGLPTALEAEQAILEDLLCREPDEPGRKTADDPDRPSPGLSGPRTRPMPKHSIEDIRYALTCWLDELFILSSPWDSEWTESKLEARLFGSNDRAWRFWERAYAVELQPRSDALEVFYLCVSLGFRGDLAERPEELRVWLDRALRRIEDLEPEPVPAALEPPCDVPPLHGRSRFRSMLLVAGIVALASIPALALNLLAR